MHSTVPLTYCLFQRNYLKGYSLKKFKLILKQNYNLSNHQYYDFNRELVILLSSRKSYDAFLQQIARLFLEILESFASMLLLCYLTAESSSFIKKKVD